VNRAAWVAGTAALAAAAYAAPAAAAIGPLRRRWLPALAGAGDPRHVALTFDDGPHPEATPALLRLLDIVGVRATFFVVGRDLEEHPELGRELAAAGHEVGVHGYDHRLLPGRTPVATLTDLSRATAAVTAITGTVPRWWRPPYGVASTTALVAAHRLGLIPVLWTCWGRDWTSIATPDRIHRSVARRLAGGGTILLHDSDHYATPRSWEATLAALPGILGLCQARGLAVGPLGEHRVRNRRGGWGSTTSPAGGAPRS
jgi:peptidoglycan/xylan/chitin deacetylase (PgdA/CDA1 family)